VKKYRTLEQSDGCSDLSGVRSIVKSVARKLISFTILRKGEGQTKLSWHTCTRHIGGTLKL